MLKIRTLEVQKKRKETRTLQQACCVQTRAGGFLSLPSDVRFNLPFCWGADAAGPASVCQCISSALKRLSVGHQNQPQGHLPVRPLCKRVQSKPCCPQPSTSTGHQPFVRCITSSRSCRMPTEWSSKAGHQQQQVICWQSILPLMLQGIQSVTGTPAQVAWQRIAHPCMTLAFAD